MAASRSYLAGVEAGLVALSQGTCYWPGCREAVITMVKHRPMLNLEIAHIIGLNKGSARYTNTMSDHDKNAFPNLMLMCGPHHKTIDGVDRGEYPSPLLAGWKKIREDEGQSTLKGLEGLTEEKLQFLLTDALSVYSESINAAIDRLESVDYEAAGMLRQLVDQVSEVRTSGFYHQADSAELLHTAAQRLAGLESNAANLMSAAATLEDLHLPSLIAQMEALARRLGGMM